MAMIRESEQSSLLEVSVSPDGIMLSRLSGAITGDRIEDLRRDVATAKLVAYGEYQRRGAKFKSLVDLTDFKGVYVPEALSLLAELMRANKSYIQKSAMFGGSEATTIAANMVVIFSDRNNISFFKTKDEALVWLNA